MNIMLRELIHLLYNMKYNVSENIFCLICQRNVLWICVLFKIVNSQIFQAHNFTWEVVKDGDKNLGPGVIKHWVKAKLHTLSEVYIFCKP